MNECAVTNTLLHRAYAAKDDADLTPLRVQALLYLLHGWYLAIVGAPLLSAPFVAGAYGPMLPALKERLASYGSTPVDEYLNELDMETFTMRPLFVNEAALPQFRAILEQVWRVYRPLTTVQLRALAHQGDSPWSRTVLGQPIDNALIRAEFIERARRSQPV